MKPKVYNYPFDPKAWKNLSPQAKHRNVLMLLLIYAGLPVMLWLGFYWCVWGEMPW